MKINLLTNSVKDRIRDELVRLFNGKIGKVYIDVCCPSEVEDILNRFEGLEVEEEIDINGWDWDFWKYFDYKGKRYCLSGSGYYGKTCVEEEYVEEEEA